LEFVHIKGGGSNTRSGQRLDWANLSMDITQGGTFNWAGGGGGGVGGGGGGGSVFFKGLWSQKCGRHDQQKIIPDE